MADFSHEVEEVKTQHIGARGSIRIVLFDCKDVL